MTRTQVFQILDHLYRGYTLTALEAVQRFGCLRLAARVEELRRAGHQIETEWIADSETGKHFARYRLRAGQGTLPGMRRTA